MNLEESDIFKEEIEKNSKHKKNVMLSIIVCVIIMIVLIALIIYIRYVDSRTLKLFVDNKQLSIPSDFYIVEDNKRYVNLDELSGFLGYDYTKGVYNLYNEDDDSCYMQNKFETIAISSGKNKFEKYITLVQEETIGDIPVTSKSDSGYCESFTIDEPAKFIDGSIYIYDEYIPKMFNVSLKWTEYRIYFYTLEYNIALAQKTISKMGYTEMSGYYENIRAIADGYAIVGNNTKVYGVVSLNNESEIISIKYDDIKYVQNTEEFYVTVADGTMGLMSSKGQTIIPPTEYEDISLLDEQNQLYLVEKNNEYGVLSRNGDVIAYAENDEIGYDVSKFNTEYLGNDLLWFNKCIPVRKNGKYGLYNKDGENELLLQINYEGFGYLSSESKSSGNQQSVLVIPGSVGIEGIVIKYNDLYGIYDVNEERIVLTCVFTKIYSITKSGNTKYYIEYNGQEMDLAEYLEQNNLVNIDKNGKYINSNDYEEETSDSQAEEENLNDDINDNTNETNNSVTNETSSNSNSVTNKVKNSNTTARNNTSDEEDDL